MTKVKVIILSLIIALLPAACFGEGEDISVYINGVLTEFPASPYTENYRTMVPMRRIFESLGAEVQWDNNTQSVTSETDDTVVILAIGMNTMYVNGKAVTLDVRPALVNDTTYVPLRAVSEAFGCAVDWDEASRSVYITTGENNIKSFEGYTDIPDFGAAFGVSPAWVSGDGTIYVYNAADLPENAQAEYQKILTSKGFQVFEGNGYMIYTRDFLSVMAGYSGDMFRIVICPY